MSALADSCLPACGNCGAKEVRNRVRYSRAGSHSAQIICTACGARSSLFVGRDAPRQALDAWRRRPAVAKTNELPTQSQGASRLGAIRSRDAERRDPLELIARMAVGGTYRIPTQGRSTAPLLSAADVSGAVGMMRDSVAKQTALAVALRADGGALLALGRSAARRVFRDCLRKGASSPLKMNDPSDRWRMRLVLQDAVNDLVWPERKPSAQAAARQAKMRKDAYLRVYRMVAAVLAGALEDGRREFARRLFKQ